MSEVKESKFIKYTCYAVPILLVLYVLSIGPAAAFLCDSDGRVKNPEHEALVFTFYTPLIYVATSNKFLLNAYVSYVNLWNDSNTSVE
ncbi:hypothetical protein V144x_26560 [Gimesia aquarii]|uniref:Uncharacterized protein n=1 Tax=Gimesia aquarii TaxID=2527964 RepID=A0A517VW10_9PLAN|nr:hypothetical protein V144x_26560 [Gimesia aquarii]